MSRLKTVKNKNVDDFPAYFSWNTEQGKQVALGEFAKGLDSLESFYASDRYSNVTTNTSARDGFSRADYNWFRPEERVGSDIKSVIGACMKAYDKFSLVRNIIDLMADFASTGIRLAHKNKKQEKAYKHWFKIVKGKERSERFLNLLYMSGNVIVSRTKAQVKNNKSFVNSFAAIGDDIGIIPKPVKNPKNLIPYSYKFLDPMSVGILGDELAVFADKFQYTINIPATMKARIQKPKNDLDKELIESLPKNIVDQIKQGKNKISLNPDSTLVFHYKKHDWQSWAYPMTSSILEDLITLDKMKLAELTALDGATGKCRVFALGDLEHKILPGPGLITAFKNMLLNRVPGTTLDIVWNPAIKILETNTDLTDFLGQEKFAPVYSAIYSGLGIPSTLAAGSGDKGFSNNFISMKTLLERLQYGRDVLMEFWKAEIKIFQEAMGYDDPAEIIFDNMNLSDESAEKALWVQLFDRNVVSLESLQERFDLIPEIEKYRIQREYKDINNRTMPEKAGPYAESSDRAYKKILLQNGELTPSELGIELDPKANGEKSRFQQTQEIARKAQMNSPAQKGVSGEGRPQNSKDSQQRKQRQPKPRTSLKASQSFAHDMVWAKNNYQIIKEKIKNVYLTMRDKQNLNEQEDLSLNKFAFNIMCNVESHNENVNENTIKSIIDNGLTNINNPNIIFDNYILSEINNDNINEYAGFIFALFKQEKG